MSKLKGQTCRCPALPEAIYWASKPDGFESTLVELSVGNWVKLFRCSVCEQRWRVDEWDKYQSHCGEDTRYRVLGNLRGIAVSKKKRLLLQSRGGVSDNLCQWAHCGKSAVKGIAFCADRLYETGERK